ncbi:MAG: UDP-N-acetylmuramoyl-tripeptide--D-alanyl-D-alanine ligase [Candidatus Yanofskybacteria bacterium]|nr:UDP-N-acetylmuramoyl-tripeptide--D-alanyl-D-alanine ligase [Candidatus Yanofskybacteria bacterium]
MRKLLKLILKILAKRIIIRYRPTVIGITGSVGKTTAKEAIFAVLSRKFWVCKNEENYNNEFGVPMAVLMLQPGGRGMLYWPSVLIKSAWLAYGPFKSSYPEMLVLELAADKPGDIDYLVGVVGPKVGVVTAVGEVPVHIEFYASPQAVAQEKSKLIAQLPSEGLAVLNYDDQTVLDMKEKSKAKVVTFGLSDSADIRASDINYFINEQPKPSGDIAQHPKRIGGLAFKLNSESAFVPARINNLIGVHQLYAVLAAVAVGQHFGINLIDAAGVLENINLPKQRMNLACGIKNSILIDDTYNASPISMHAALDTLRDFAPAHARLGHKSRRIAVLGDMKELGKYELEAHRTIGNFAAGCCDILVTVGGAGKIIADSAANQMAKENIFSFSTSEEAAPRVQEIIQEDDIVLIKGSRAMKMEKVVDEIKESG